MNCPHCLVEFHDEPDPLYLGDDSDGDWALIKRKCANPSCKKYIMYLQNGEASFGGTGLERYFAGMSDVYKEFLVYPRLGTRLPCPNEVPKKFAEDYNEASLVLADSSKASAALSRRCLQSVLRETAKVKHGNLFDEIQEVIDSGKLPSHISESIDAVRHIGNFAVHPIKNKSTGEIVPVEPGEAEWNLNVLEDLFDFYFVAPAKTQKKKDALNKKLKDAGKPLMK